MEPPRSHTCRYRDPPPTEHDSAVRVRHSPFHRGAWSCASRPHSKLDGLLDLQPGPGVLDHMNPSITMAMTPPMTREARRRLRLNTAWPGEKTHWYIRKNLSTDEFDL